MKTHIRIYVSILLVLCLTSCRIREDKPNQEQGARSPSGRYVVQVPIEANTKNFPSETPVWKVTILDASGKLLYEDEDSKFIGMINVYWGWDSSDRLWLYNSDDGSIWHWELVNLEWQKNQGEGNHSIPNEVLPDYAK